MVHVPRAFAETYNIGTGTIEEISTTDFLSLVELKKPWKLHPDEPYSIRPLDPNVSTDTQFYTDIDRSPEVMRWTVPSRRSKPHEIDSYTRVSPADKENPRMLFAVVNEENIPVGWVQFYLDENRKWLAENAGITPNALVLEISYAKLNVGMKGKFPSTGKSRENFPKEQPRRVAVSGVRQSTEYIRRMEEKMAKASFEPVRSIWFTAYTDPKNVASERVLEANGFIRLDKQIDYEGEPNNVWIKPPTHEVTRVWKNLFDRSRQKYPEDTVFIESGRIKQKEGYDCGPATVVNALKALGIETELDTITQEARNMLSEQQLDIEEIGTPPEAIKVLLGMRGVSYREKTSDPDSSTKNVSESLEWLKEQLMMGCICICPIQTTPEYWLLDSETGMVAREAEVKGARNPITNTINPRYKVIHTDPNKWDAVNPPNPDNGEGDTDKKVLVVASTKNDPDYNGHYVLVVGVMRTDDREFIITVDPSYRKPQERKSSIDPEFAGVRFIEAGVFGRNWHDVSGLGEVLNQYAIAIPTSQRPVQNPNE